MSPHNRETGSVLFLILIAVVLFTALSYAVTQTTRGGGIEPSDEKAELLAGEIMNYVTALQTAITRLQVSNGCEDTEISFENPVVAGYTNPNAPPDKSCHVFDPEGAGISYQIVKENVFDSGFSDYESEGYGVWVTSTDKLRYVGNSPNWASGPYHLGVFLHFINKNICLLINERFDVENTNGNPPRAHSWSGKHKFTGAYTSGAIIRTLGNEVDGHRVGCYEGNSATVQPNGSYHFYAILIAH